MATFKSDLIFPIIRSDDLLICIVCFHNVWLTKSQSNRPGQISGFLDSSMSVYLQPQHIAEKSITKKSITKDEHPYPPAGSVTSRLAGYSRLVFNIPFNRSIQLTLEDILDALPELPLRVAQRARKPGPFQTAIELPYRLILTPRQQGRWRHASKPINHNEWKELWHTSLTKNMDVRAIHNIQRQDDDFSTSLNNKDRRNIVDLTSQSREFSRKPVPLQAEQFMLSTLGGWLKIKGDWDVERISLEAWNHQVIMGRDQFVRIVEKGFIFPFGHKASKVTIHERQFVFDTNQKGYTAYLLKHEFITLRDVTCEYKTRGSLFRSISIQPQVTPDLFIPEENPKSKHFWIQIPSDNSNQGKDLLFHLQGIDWEGNVIEWTSPLIFVEEGGEIQDVQKFYGDSNGDGNDKRRKRPFSGQSIAFAPSSNGTEGKTTLKTLEISFIGEGEALSRLIPRMKEAKVEIPAVQQLLGEEVPCTIEWEETYLKKEDREIGNVGEVFAKIKDTESKIKFDPQKVGGMLAPDLNISGLSRTFGPVGGKIEDMIGKGNNEFSPGGVFPDVKLLGCIELKDIVKNISLNSLKDTIEIPSLITRKEEDTLITEYHWEVKNTNERFESTDIFQPDGQSKLTLKAEMRSSLDGSRSSYKVDGCITDFSVNIKLIEIQFKEISFQSVPGRKPDVSVKFKDIKFIGILEFVSTLQKYIPLSGFDDPPSLEIVTTPPKPGAKLGFTYGIPTLSIGVMSIQNIALSAGFFLPFGGDPLNFHFAFCERHQPFLLTVYVFGGGGFFSIDVGLAGVVMIEAAFEFGASVALNLGVAKGAAAIMAGIYFQKVGEEFRLEGYFRAAGALSILGIISLSLEFYLGLAYTSKGSSPRGGKLWGQASLKVKVEVLFFSKSVNISMEREFAGSDPKFIDMVTLDHWHEYVNAFADYA